jgi:hypothetical protein
MVDEEQEARTRYAMGKLGVIVDDMACSEGTLRERLGAALQTLQSRLIDESHMPNEEMAQTWRSLWSHVTPAKGVSRSLRDLPDATVKLMARTICQLASMVEPRKIKQELAEADAKAVSSSTPLTDAEAATVEGIARKAKRAMKARKGTP